MTEQATPTKEAAPNAQPNEAGFSTNLFLNHQVMGRVQFTFRGATSADWGVVLEDLEQFLRYMREKGWKFDGEKQDVVPVQQPPEEKRIPIDDGGNELPAIKQAVAGRLSVETKDEKVYFKIVDATFARGEKGTKYGVSIYPEVLEGAGLDVRPGQPVPQIAGWRFEYICNDKGFPQKVTRLLPPK